MKAKAPTETKLPARGSKAMPEDLISRYLREVQTAPLLEREEEARHARQLWESRDAFAIAVRTLPTRMQESLISDRDSNDATRWPLEKLEAIHVRLEELTLNPTDPEVTVVLTEALRHKRRIDAAREALITSHLRFVAHVVRQYKFLDVPFLDLVQEGNVGLLKALDRFDPAKGFRFSTYAYWWIRQAITRAVVDKSRLIRLPEHIQARISQVRRAYRELRESLDRRPNDGEIAEKLDLPIKKVEELVAFVQDPDPLEDHGTEEEGGRVRVIENLSVPSPLETALQQEKLDRVVEAVNSLTPREQRVIRLRFGMEGDRTHTLQETGGHLNLSRERIRQIEQIALQKIQAWHRASQASPFQAAAHEVMIAV